MKKLREYEAGGEKEKTLLIRCRNAIKTIEPTAEVVLYGSRARGNAQRESDYDLLILTDGEASLKKEDVLRRQLFSIEMQVGSVLTVFLVSKKDWSSSLYAEMPFHQNVDRDGVIL